MSRFAQKVAVCAALAGLSVAAAFSRADAPVRDVNAHRLFTPPADRKTWNARSAELRQQILFACGLWPMPEKTPLHPRVTGRIEGPDYTIENVAIETMPGFYLCGNLYRPKGMKGRHPGIANPHGHWSTGRLTMEADVPHAGPTDAMGAGRANLVSIGVNLARQGSVVFAYDMVGYNDTNQVDHRFAGGLRPWLWNVSLLGLQTWNSIRVVDYLCSLPDVDSHRIGVTGASGGGTQTFILSAIDDRLKAAVPVNMISAHMAGGCLCENGPGLRIDTDNAEIGALFAPKPLLLVAATGDWTKNNPTEEGPAIRKVYDLYGAGDRTSVQQFNYQHNYNVESREAMYAWFGRWLNGRTDAAELKEKPFTVDVKAMRVWTDRTPMPANALKEPDLTAALEDRSERQLAERWPRSAEERARFKEVYGPALRHALALGDSPIANGPVRGRIGGRAILVLHEPGEAPPAEVGPAAAELSLDCSRQKPEALWSNFYSCYNRTRIQEQVKQVAEELARLKTRGASRVDLVALGRTGVAALLARAVSGVPGRTAASLGGLDLADDGVWTDRFYAPGLRRAGDIRAAAALAGSPLFLFNAGDSFRTEMLAESQMAAGAPFRVERGSLAPAEIARWLAGR